MRRRLRRWLVVSIALLAVAVVINVAVAWTIAATTTWGQPTAEAEGYHYGLPNGEAIRLHAFMERRHAGDPSVADVSQISNFDWRVRSYMRPGATRIVSHAWLQIRGSYMFGRGRDPKPLLVPWGRIHGASVFPIFEDEVYRNRGGLRWTTIADEGFGWPRIAMWQGWGERTIRMSGEPIEPTAVYAIVLSDGSSHDFTTDPGGRALPLGIVWPGFLVNTGVYWAALMVVPVVIVVWSLARSVVRSMRGRCVRCGYDLRESAGVCPECGRRSRLVSSDEA